MSRVILFGGTFDPIHLGHLILAEEVLDGTGADRILFVPAGVPPHKIGVPVTEARHRLEMVKMAIGDNPRFGVSDVEIRRSGPSYTIDTLRAIRAGLGDGDELGIIVGADQVMEFETWKDYLTIAEEFRLFLTTRAGLPDPDKEKHPHFRNAVLVSIPSVEISSTDVRRRVREGRSIRYLVPREVSWYIREERLYL
jgi:nicotinate-nucleotide adenylyltransferase